MNKSTIAEFRDVLDVKTNGAVNRLNMAIQTYGLDGHIWAEPNGLIVLWGTDPEGRTQYFDTAMIRPDPALIDLTRVMQNIREAKKASERLRKGVARLDAGMDPEESLGDPSLN